MFRIGNPLLRIAAASLAMIGISCIDRSNPFDPLNAGSPDRVRAGLATGLDSLTAGEPALAAHLAAYAKAVSGDSLDNDARVKGNAAKRGRNADAASGNALVQSSNRSAPVESLAFLTSFVDLDTLKAYGPYAEYQARRNSLRAQAATLAGFMAQANADHAPTVVYPPAFADSVLAPFARDTAAFARLQARIDSGNAAVGDSNAAVKAYNADRDADNAAVSAYNDSIDFLRHTPGKNVITRPDSLQATTFVAKAGDSLLIGAGSYLVDLRFTNSGTVDSPIVVRGYPGMRTVLRAAIDKATGKPGASAMILSSRAYIRFEDVVFRGGGISAVKLEAGTRNVSFRRCTFDSSAQFGLEVIDSDVDLLDCRLLANGKGARIQGNETKDYRIRLQNVLVARNSGHGLETVTPFGEIANCTVADNGGDGIRVNSPRRALTVANTIVSGNEGYGIFREPENGFQDIFQVKESDVFGNTQGDWSLDALDSARQASIKGANPPVKPEFIDPARFNYGLKPGSVLEGYEHQSLPVVIGYRP